MTSYVVVGIGVALLMIFAVLIGTSMDTEGQHRSRQRTAEGRHRIHVERRELIEERERLRAERRKLVAERRALEAEMGAKNRCSQCPFPIDS